MIAFSLNKIDVLRSISLASNVGYRYTEISY